MEETDTTIVDGEIVIEESATPLSSSWPLCPIATEETPTAVALPVVAHSTDEAPGSQERSCRACKQRPCRGGPKCRELASMPRPATTPRARKPRTPSEGGTSGSRGPSVAEGPSCRVCKQRPCRNGPKCRAYNDDASCTLRAIPVAPALVAHNAEVSGGGALPDLVGDGFAHAMGGEVGTKRPREYDEGEDSSSPLPVAPIAYAHAVAIDTDGTVLGAPPQAYATDQMGVQVVALYQQGTGAMAQPMGPS